MVGIVSGCGTNIARPPPVEGLNQKIVRVGDLRESFLRESAGFDMGPHPGGTIHDAFLQGTAGALMDVLNRETAFCFRDSGRVIGWVGLRLQRASIQYAGFVEMNNRLHHTRCGEFTGQVQLFAHRFQGLANGYDFTVVD